MAEVKAGNGGDASAGAGRQFALQRLYVKDVSFEAPNSPDVFSSGALEPELELNLRNTHRATGDNAYEVVLHISVHAKAGEKSVFLVELDQAGIFQIGGYGLEETRTILGTHCPATLFPYAREAISSLVTKGGFPPLVLQPINFDALFVEANRQERDIQ